MSLKIGTISEEWRAKVVIIYLKDLRPLSNNSKTTPRQLHKLLDNSSSIEMWFMSDSNNQKGGP